MHTNYIYILHTHTYMCTYMIYTNSIQTILYLGSQVDLQLLQSPWASIQPLKCLQSKLDSDSAKPSTILSLFPREIRNGD